MKIVRWYELSSREKTEILSRPMPNEMQEVENKVKSIIAAVKNDRDKALYQFTAEYERIQLERFQVTPEEIEKAFRQIDPASLDAIQFAKDRLDICHQASIPTANVVETFKGVRCERQPRPIEKVGLYVPGGSAPLVSTVLMLGVPAQMANCPLRILCSPADMNGNISPDILVAAKLCGIDKIFKVGGAQAIAAMAYGTETIPKVDKIFGPGNRWVTCAKKIVANVFQEVTIDLPAGPSELVVIADENANPDFVVADLLSQAEHGPDSQVILIATSELHARKVKEKIYCAASVLSRRNIIEMALENSRIILAKSIQAAISISNAYAPEHLILQVANAEAYLSLIQNAGAVFVGNWIPEALGDYITGSNHVLPTYGYARNMSGLSVIDFLKTINFQYATPEGLKAVGPYAMKLAEMEGLLAHKNAIETRLRSMTS